MNLQRSSQIKHIYQLNASFKYRMLVMIHNINLVCRDFEQSHIFGKDESETE